jgi:WD40 repeat protein
VALFKLNALPRAIHVEKKTLFVLGTDCSLCSMKLSENLKTGLPPETVPLGSIAPFLIIPASEEATPSRSFAFLSECGRFVSSSLWDNSFHVFKLGSNSLIHKVSLRQKFSLLSTLNCAGGSLLLTSWRDSSLTLWNLADAKGANKPLYRKTPHLVSVVDVEVNVSLGLIASLDKARKCIFSVLQTGKFVRAFDVDGTDSLQRILLISSGFLAVLSESELDGMRKTTVRCFGLNTRNVKTVDIHEPVASWAKAELKSGINVIGIGFRNGNVVVLEVPQLRQVMTVSVGKPIVEILFAEQFTSFLIVDGEGGLYFVSIT